MHGIAHEPTRPRLLLAALSLGAFTTALNVTLISPLLKPVAQEFGVSAAAAGQLATLTATCAGLTALVVAPWLDRVSRRGALRLEATLLGAGTLLSALAPTFGWLFAGRALAGVGGAVIFAVCLAGVGDLFADPARRNRAIGVVSTAATLGAVLGLPVATQFAAAAGWRWATAALVPLSAALFAGAALLPRAAPPGVAAARPAWAAEYRRVLANRETVALLGVLVSLSLTWFGWLIYFGAYAQTVYGVGAATLGLLFMVGGAAEIVGNNLAPLLLEKRPPRVVTLWSTAALAANLLAVGVVYTRAWALFPFIAAASLAGVVPFMSTSIQLLDSQPTARGAVMALQSAGFEFGGALGAALVGTGLAVLGDYEAAYRALGVVLPALVIPLTLAGRRAAAPAPDAPPA